MVIEYDFNQFNEVSEERWFNPGETEAERTIVFEYDRYGRLTHVDDADTDYTYEYDEFGRLRVETVTTDDSVTSFVYRYDGRSRVESVTAFIDGNEDFTNAYKYNADGLVRELTQTGPDVISKRVTFDYDVLDHTVTQSRYEGENLVVRSTSSYSPLPLGEGQGEGSSFALAGISHVDAYGNVLASHGYTYNDAGLVETYSNDTDSVQYDYDPTGQLIDADYDTQTDETFEYDANGNQLQFTIGTNNQILCDGLYWYSYDAEGSRTEKYQWADENSDGLVDDSEKFDVTTYSWDARGRLIKITTLPDGSEATKTVKYDYDYLNRRTEKQIKETNSEGKKVKSKESYTYLGHDIVLQSNDNELSHRYLHHPDVVDQCLADESIFDDNVLYPLFDNLNSVRDIADYDPDTDLTDIVNSIAYSASGKVVAETDPSIGHIYGHAGQQIDRESGLLNRYGRNTDPRLNVFISPDPISFMAGDTNLYRYVGNNPVVFVDPTGLFGYYNDFCLSLDPSVRLFMTEFSSIDDCTKVFQVHHWYQNAVSDWVVRMSSGDIDPQAMENLRAVPTHVHREISAQQNAFWTDMKRKYKKKTIAEVIEVATKRGEDADLYKRFILMSDSVNSQYAKYMLDTSATLEDVQQLASNLGIKNADKITDTRKLAQEMDARKIRNSFKAGASSRKITLPRNLSKAVVMVGVLEAINMAMTAQAIAAPNEIQERNLNDLLLSYRNAMSDVNNHGVVSQANGMNLCDDLTTYLESINADGILQYVADLELRSWAANLPN